MEKLFLIDGSALFYRSYFAFSRNPLINSKGEDTSATFGFLNSLVKIIEDEKPEYIAVVFDTKEPTFRHKMYEEYKATRERMPEEMSAQFPRLVDSLKRLDFLLLEKEGYEADDIIGTLAKRFASDALHVYIVSGDKDMAQLVNNCVLLYTPAKGAAKPDILDAKGIKEKMGVTPSQVVDYLALMGDSSDNIPGVPKVGKVTAVKLLNKFNDLEGVYRHIDEVDKPSVRQSLIENKDKALLSQKLATIETDMPVEYKLDDMKFKMWDLDAVRELLKELEFRRLHERMQHFVHNSGTADMFDTHEEKKVNYTLIDSAHMFDQFIKNLEKQEYFVFDLETDSLDILEAEIAGIAFSWEKDEGYYVPLHHPDISLDEKEVYKALKAIFADPISYKIAHNIKFDAGILEQHGIKVESLYFDTMIAAYLLNPGDQVKLDKLSEKYLNYEMIHIEELIGSGKKQKLMTHIAAKEVYNYAAEDADITWQLYELFKPRLKELNMEELFYDLEMPLVRVLMSMEGYGVTIDVELLKKISDEISAVLEKLENDIYKKAGEIFNINSPQQLGVVLFQNLKIHEELGYRKPKKTKTGQFSTSEKTLERYAEHPIINNILEIRKLSKLKNTYLDAIPQLVNPRTGRVHTSFNQTVAATGRLSSSNPNFQNIPIRTEIGREIRRAFIPSKAGNLILSADYSQIELRIMAHLSGDEAMKAAFKNNLDIHTATAALIFDVEVEDVDADMRRKAKEINFGIIYGMSRYGLADRLHIGVDEAQDFIDNYMATYAGVARYMEDIVKFAKEHGYVETIMHRRRYVPELRNSNRQIREFGERTAINTPIQGSAADMIKLAMIEIDELIRREKIAAHMILQVHDELIFDIEKEAVDSFKNKLRDVMENALPLSIPLIVDIGEGENWLEAH